MTDIDTPQQQTPDKARQGRVTGSIVGALLDCAPYMSKDAAFRTVVRSMHNMPSEFMGNIATEWGNANEALALAAYEMETGNDVVEAGFVPFDNWLGDKPTGYVDGDGLVMVRCPFGIRKSMSPVFKSLDVHPQYYAQIQIQLFCTDRDWCDFWQWTPHGRSIERVKYNPEWIAENIPALLAMWQDANNADPKDYEGPVRPVFDTPETGRLVTEWDELSDAIDNATDRKKDIIERLSIITSGKDGLVSGRKFTLVERVGSVSYAQAVKKLLPNADLEPYRGNASESWKLT